MKMLLRHRLLVALTAVGLGLAAGAITIAPVGCASDCGNNCPITSAVIIAAKNVDPGILEVAWSGPACPPVPPECRGDDRITFCNRVYVAGHAEGYCDVLIQLALREPMAVRVQFGPATTQGCCKGYPVIGDSYFTIPLEMDAGIYGADGNTDAVSIYRPDAGTSKDAGGSDAGDGGAADADSAD